MGKRVSRGRFLSDFSPQCGGAAAAGTSPPKDDGRGDKDRGVSSDDYADNDGKGKVTQHRTAKEKQAHDRDERDCAGKDRAAERLVNAFVHDLLDRAATSAGQAFSNPVVNDDGVVNGVT